MMAPEKTVVLTGIMLRPIANQLDGPPVALRQPALTRKQQRQALSHWERQGSAQLSLDARSQGVPVEYFRRFESDHQR
jgi:hypothetical protein